MNNIEILQDSIDTSISMNFYKTREEASKEHIFNSRLIKMELKKFKNVDNFNSERLKKSAFLAYPLNDRPRKDKDIKSVKFYQNLIKNKKDKSPIWLIYKNRKYILLDGAHRIVASYIENKKYINSFIINNKN